MTLRHLDLFSGIGGFALAARMVGGYETVGFCEIDAYCRGVLERYWSGVPVYEDVATLAGIDGGVDVITGGFPCQDVSLAGNGAGLDGTRSGLWGELARLIRDIRPHFALVENVPGLISGGDGQWFGRVLGDLAESGYDAEWDCVPAVACGAPHLRDRVWLVAHRRSEQCGGRRCAQGNLLPREWTPARSLKFRDRREYWSGEDGAPVPNGDLWGREERAQFNSPEERAQAIWGARWRHADGCRCSTGWCVEPDVDRVVHGLPHRVDRIHALGNAIVPQVAAIFLQAIKDASCGN